MYIQDYEGVWILKIIFKILHICVHLLEISLLIYLGKLTSQSACICSAMRKNDPVSAIGASGVVDIQKLAKWFEDSRLDPNDPANADLVYMLKVLQFILLFVS